MSIRSFTRGAVIIGVAIVAATCALPEVASAYMEPNILVGDGCVYCHPSVWVDPPGVWELQRYPAAGGVCMDCHGEPLDGFDFNKEYGAHSGYTTTTSKCNNCHSVHSAPAGSIVLLPAATISATCFTCHDGTGGWGVYGTILARTGSDPGSGHSVDQTALVPGGDAGTGGSSTGSFSGVGDTLTCTDCHSPHSANVVTAFRGDRRRVRDAMSNSPTSTKLLRQQPIGGSTSTTVYGADWCLSCHAGRSSDGPVHNHPVESGDSTWNYGNVAILSGDDPTAVTVMGGMGGVTYDGGHDGVAVSGPGNRGYLMPYPRTAEQSGRAPICQQCHEDSRQVGELVANGTQGDAATASIAAADAVYWNGSAWVASADNPLFQNFPHETQNSYMLVETEDDLCLNCHPLAQLP